MRQSCVALLAMAPVVLASTTTTWEMNNYQDFLRGRFANVALGRDGRLMLAPNLEPVFASGQPAIWSVAAAPDGNLYLGTGHRGRLYKVDPAGKSSLVWTAEQPEIFALAVDARGTVYAGTSPDGRIYRIENGSVKEFFNPGVHYIWALKFGPDGALYAGTGDHGRVFRITMDGKGQVWYESGQSHISSLAFDSEGRLLAGSDPNGILYRITGKNKAFVLYDANLPEIRSILPNADGTLYVAALGGSTAKRAGTTYGVTTGAQGSVVSAPGTSITVTDSQAGGDIATSKADQTKTQLQPAATVVQPVQVIDVTGVEKSAIYKIHPDNTVETLWSSKDENIYDIAVIDDRLMFATDLQGRIYRLGRERKATLVAQTGEAETTRLLPSPAGLLASTGDMGSIYRLGKGTASHGTFEAPVHDANTVARWGRLSWRAETPQATGAAFRTRSGNSARPDNTWSDWSEPLTDPAGSLIRSPNARYIQWRLELTSTNVATPSVDSVIAAYLPQNTPPTVRSITVSTQTNAAAQKTTAAAATPAANSAFSITVTDSGDAPQTSAGTPTQTLARNAGQQTQIVWQADDSDGDHLAYSIYFRGEDEHDWKLLRSNVFENSLNIDSDVLADGRYYFRVVATDRPSNPVEYARESELVSSPVLIDNTPPVVHFAAPVQSGTMADLTVTATDQTSPLRRGEYSLDAGPWIPVEAADGVTDSPSESFGFRLEKLRPGEHLLVFRAYDAAGNAGLSKLVLK